MTRTVRAICLSTIFLAIAGCDAGPSSDPGSAGPPTPEDVTSCLEGADVPARSRARASWEAQAEVIAGEDGAVSVLFFEDEGGASSAAATLRLAGEPSIRVGPVIIIPAGPQSQNVEQAVLDCLGAELAEPAP